MRSQVEQAMKLLRRSESIEPYVFRPWFDRLTFRSVVDVYQPLSRAWALAEASGYDRERFLDSLEKPLQRNLVVERGFDWVLEQAREKAQSYKSQEASWRKAFFAEKAPAMTTLARHYEARMAAADGFSNSRALFLPLKLLGRAAPLRWRVAPPEEVEARFGPYLDAPETLFDPARPTPDFKVSHELVMEGRRHRWLQDAAAAESEEERRLWVHVIEPEGAANPPTLVFLHGISMETEMWSGFEDAVNHAVDWGFRVIRPEGPWHGRRRRPGFHGGEPVLSLGPLGFLSYITRHAGEGGQLIAWARGEGSGPVGLFGLSLGGLTAQRLASASGAWPEAYRPDSLLLMVVSGRAGSVEIGGRLARELGVPGRLADAGWSEETLAPYRVLAEPQEPPKLPASRLHMILGKEDELMPIEHGLELAKRWKVPEKNLTVTNQGHFSGYFSLISRPGPFKDFLTQLKGL
jgi:pimeloyl-ACP methyl ester carboxylesterase